MSRGWYLRARWVLLAALLMTPYAMAQGRRHRHGGHGGHGQASGGDSDSSNGSGGSGSSDSGSSGGGGSAGGGGGGAAASGSTASGGGSGGSVGGGAAGDNVCISQSEHDRALECPSGSNVRYGTTSNTAPPAAASLARDDNSKNKNKKQGPSQTLDANTLRRQGNLQRRSEQLLMSEIQLTASLVRSLRTTDPQRPEALMRLAEDLQEVAQLKRSNGRDLDEQIFQAQQANNASQVEQLQHQQQALFDEATRYRTQLVQVFNTLINDHPQYAHRDQALFYLAFAYQDAGDMTNARQKYYQLIQDYPQSPYVPNAFLSFAEFFFEQGQMAEARTFYERVIAVNTPENQVYGYALYKMAWVLYNLQDYDGALTQFFQVIEYARQHTDNPTVAPLLTAARNELVTVYGAVYGVSRPLNPRQALNTFTRYADNADNAFEMLEHLAELYQDNGQWPNSIAVYHEMMAQRPNSDSLCKWQGQVAKAVVASAPQRDAQVRELRRLVDIYQSYRDGSSNRSQAAKNDCRDATARVVFDVASHWHLEAIGQNGDGNAATATRGTRDPQTMQRAAALYDLLLDQFPDLDEVTFPDYNRTDWPTRYRIAYYRADILRDQGNFAECGPAYDRVVEMNPTGEYVEDAAYKAVLCYNDSWSRTMQAEAQHHPNREINVNGQGGGGHGHGHQDQAQQQSQAQQLAPHDMSPQDRAMATAFTRYICYARNVLQGGAGASDAGTAQIDPNNDPRTDYLNIMFRRAYLYYRNNQFEAAATLFHDVAFSDPTIPDRDNARQTAADLYLDALNVMGSIWEPTRPACFTQMADNLQPIKDRFCGEATRGSFAEFCDRMDGLQCQILRKHAESLHNSRRFAEAAHEYISILRNHSECLATDGAHPDEILYNASIDYDAANQLGRSMRVRDVLITRFLDRGSQWAQKALFRLAGNYQRIQVFSRAADLYEQYADYVTSHREAATAADPEAVNQAADGLRIATRFRIGLGEEDHALDNAAKFARYFGSDPNPARRRQATDVVFTIGQIYQDRAERIARVTGGSREEQGRREAAIHQAWQDVVRYYTNFVNRYARNGTLDQQIQGNVALGRGYWNLDDQDHARLYFTAAVGAWGEPDPPPSQGNPNGGPTPGEQRIRDQLHEQGDEAAATAVEHSKEAVAEAKFHLAEVIYNRFAARRLPAYHGAPTRTAYDRWNTATLAPFVTEQFRYIREDATPQFVSVINMHVPSWEIAAYAELADMFLRFGRYFREADVPPDIRRNPDLLDAYNVRRDEFTQQFYNSAQEGFERCLHTATEVHWFNKYSAMCEERLNFINPRQYPLADELRNEPSLVFSRAANSRPVYEIDTGDDVGDDSPNGAPAGGAPQGGAQPAGGNH